MPNKSRLSCTNGGLRKYPTFADVTKNGACNTRNQNEKNDNSTKDTNSGRSVSRESKIELSLPTSATTSDSYEWRVQERRGKRKNVAERCLTPKRTELMSYPAVQKTVTNTSVNIGVKNNNNKTFVRTPSGLDRPIERARNGILKNLITQKPEVGVIFNQRTFDYYRKVYGISENTVWSEVVKGTATGTLNRTTTDTATGTATGTAIASMTKYNQEELNEQRSQYKLFKREPKTKNYSKYSNSTSNNNNSNNNKNKISFNKTIEKCESKYSFGKNNSGKKNQLDTTYTFGNFERNEVTSNNSRLVLRSPRSPPSSEAEEKCNEDQPKDKNQTKGINKAGGSEKPTLEYRLEQQILTLKSQNLTVNQLYIVDLMEDLLLKYQAEVYGTDESKPQSNGFSNNYNNNNHRESGSNDVVQLVKVLERPTRSGQLTNQKISSTTVVLETVQEKRERNKRAAKPAQSLDNNGAGNNNNNSHPIKAELEAEQGHRDVKKVENKSVKIKDESRDKSGELIVGANAGNYTNGRNEASHTQRWNHIDECGNIVVGIVNPEYHSEWESMEVTEIYRKSGKREAFLEERNNNKN